MRRSLAGSVIAVMMLGAGLFASAQASFERHERKVPGRLLALRSVDIDADGVKDLLFTAIEGTTRRVGYFAGRATGSVAATPAAVCELKPDVVLVGVGDVDAANGRELVLFTARSIFAYRWHAESESRRYVRLFREEGFFAFADPAAIPIWPHVGDLDGDGFDDVCVGTPTGHTIRYQSREGDRISFERRDVIGAWVDQSSADNDGQRGMRLSVSLGGGDDSGPAEASSIRPTGGYLVEASRRMSAPLLADENGDGRRDLLILEGNQIKVWRQRKKGGFNAVPDVRRDVHKLMAKTPRWSRSGNIRHVDVDGDGTLDFLVRQEVANELRTRLLLFTGGVAGFDRPASILMLSGLTATPRFRDVNGDGKLDLLIPTYRLDLLKKARKAAIKSLDVTLHVFLNRGDARVFGRRPDYSHDETLRTDNLAVSGVEPMVFLDGDFNRDRRSDLLVIDESNRLKIRLATKTAGGLFSRGGKFAFHGRPAIQEEVEVPNRLDIEDLDGDGQSEIIMLYRDRFVIGGWGLTPGGRR